jgi:hypothetical protein
MGSEPEARGHQFIRTWGLGVQWISVLITVAFIPVMAYWAIVAPHSRWVTIPAIAICVYFARLRLRDLHELRGRQ